MKRWFHIAIAIVMAVFSACNRPVETRHGTSLPSAASPQLQAVDSLMWTRPDSALARIMPWLDTCLRDCNVSENSGDSGADVARYVSTAYDRHYANLLLSELLYKNDYGQTNREELLEAVAYFDSLTIATDTRDVSLHRPARRDTSKYEVFDGVNVSATDAQTLAFLDARAHYINGVGYYERDSVVEACKEYLKALEVMEAHFEEKELVGKYYDFMGLTFMRLGDLFYSNGIATAAIYSYKNASACFKEGGSLKRLGNAYRGVANAFRLEQMNDSAMFFFGKAMASSEQSGNPAFRVSLLAESAPVLYDLGYSDTAFATIRKALEAASNEDLFYARCFTMGSLFFKERLYDSAILYLEKSVNRNDFSTQTASMEMLIDCYQATNDSAKSLSYRLIQSKNLSLFVDKVSSSSQLVNLFETYKHERDERVRRNATKQNAKARSPLIVVIFSIIIIGSIVLYIRVRKDKRDSQRIKAQLERDFDKAHQKLMEKEKTLTAFERQMKALTFQEEPICQHILGLVHQKQFIAKVDSSVYKESALTPQQLQALRTAVDTHYDRFTTRLQEKYPALTDDDVTYCCLYLLGLKNADCAALMQRAYVTVCERNRKLKGVFGLSKSLTLAIQQMAQSNIL